MSRRNRKAERIQSLLDERKRVNDALKMIEGNLRAEVPEGTRVEWITSGVKFCAYQQDGVFKLDFWSV